MFRQIRPRLTYANVMATLAFFLAIGGGAYAALHLPKNSVKSKNIVNGQVKAEDLSPPGKLKSAGLAENPSFNCANAPNQWASSEPAVNGSVGYYRDAGGTVHLSGQAARCGSPPTGNTIFVLPRGYRPDVSKDETGVKAGGTFMEVTIDKQGDVIPPAAVDLTIVSLDGISFRCGPPGKQGCP